MPASFVNESFYTPSTEINHAIFGITAEHALSQFASCEGRTWCLLYAAGHTIGIVAKPIIAIASVALMTLLAPAALLCCCIYGGRYGTGEIVFTSSKILLGFLRTAAVSPMTQSILAIRALAGAIFHPGLYFCSYDKANLLTALEQDIWCLRFANPELLNDPEVILKALRGYEDPNEDFHYCGWTLTKIPSKIQDDTEFVLEARSSSIIPFLPLFEKTPVARIDKNIFIKAVENDPKAFQCIDHTMKFDQSFILEAVAVNPAVLEYIPLPLKKDKNFILEAISRDALSLKYAVTALLDDKEFALKAIRANGLLFLQADYFSSELKNDKELINEAKNALFKTFASLNRTKQEECLGIIRRENKYSLEKEVLAYIRGIEIPKLSKNLHFHFA